MMGEMFCIGDIRSSNISIVNYLLKMIKLSKISEHFENLSINAHGSDGIDSSSGSEEFFLEYFSIEELLEESGINAPTTLGIYNYFIIPNINCDNIKKLILVCVARIDTFDTYIKRMPKLEYFGYVYYTHKFSGESQAEFDRNAWIIITINYTENSFL